MGWCDEVECAVGLCGGAQDVREPGGEGDDRAVGQEDRGRVGQDVDGGEDRGCCLGTVVVRRASGRGRPLVVWRVVGDGDECGVGGAGWPGGAAEQHRQASAHGPCEGFRLGDGGGGAGLGPPERRLGRGHLGAEEAFGLAGYATSAPAGSGSSGSGHMATTTMPAAMAMKGMGSVVTDDKGMTLYRYDRHQPTPSKWTCSGECTKAWMLVIVQDSVQTLGVEKSLLGTVHRDGMKQLTLCGWPLYRDGRHRGRTDERPGQAQAAVRRHPVRPEVRRACLSWVPRLWKRHGRVGRAR